MARHCPECGFVNPEGANYCQKCGAYLGGPAESGDDPTTMTYKVDDTGDMQPVDIDEVVEQAGAALVVRAGGGRGRRHPTPFLRYSGERAGERGERPPSASDDRLHAPLAPLPNPLPGLPGRG